jgi:hypothetical protein
MIRASLVLLATIPASVSVTAHHSFAAFYFEDQMMTIEGELVEFDFRNPHVWLHVMAMGGDGRPQRFSAEWASPGRLSRSGLTKDTLKPGDRLIVGGSPSRTLGDNKLHVKRIERPADGWKWLSPNVPR